MSTVDVAVPETQSSDPEWSFAVGGQVVSGWDWGAGPPDVRQLGSVRSSGIEEAVTRFAPWVEAIPRTPDGLLGWVGDHTRHTSSTTRLDRHQFTHPNDQPTQSAPGRHRVGVSVTD